MIIKPTKTIFIHINFNNETPVIVYSSVVYRNPFHLKYINTRSFKYIYIVLLTFFYICTVSRGVLLINEGLRLYPNNLLRIIPAKGKSNNNFIKRKPAPGFLKCLKTFKPGHETINASYFLLLIPCFSFFFCSV